MFKKFRERRAEKKNKDAAALVAWQEAFLKKSRELLSAAEAVTDPAVKILVLKQLVEDIRDADWNVDRQQTKMIKRRTYNRTDKAMGAVALAGVAALAIPAALLAPPLVIFAPLGMAGAIGPAMRESKTYEKKRKELLERNPALASFSGEVNTLANRAQAMLDETIQNCDLKGISQSPRFHEALDESQPLRKRFAEAATQAARQEQEEKAGPQEPVRKAPPRKLHSYGVLKKVIK